MPTGTASSRVGINFCFMKAHANVKFIANQVFLNKQERHFNFIFRYYYCYCYLFTKNLVFGKLQVNSSVEGLIVTFHLFFKVFEVWKTIFLASLSIHFQMDFGNDLKHGCAAVVIPNRSQKLLCKTKS